MSATIFAAFNGPTKKKEYYAISCKLTPEEEAMLDKPHHQPSMRARLIAAAEAKLKHEALVLATPAGGPIQESVNAVIDAVLAELTAPNDAMIAAISEACEYGDPKETFQRMIKAIK